MTLSSTQIRKVLKSPARAAIGTLLWLKGLHVPTDYCFYHRWVAVTNVLERDIVRFARRFIRPGIKIVDVGANIGLLARYFCSKTGSSGAVFAFEPDPAIASILRANVRKYPWCEVSEQAVSDQNGPATFYIDSRSSTSNSLLNRDFSDRSITVECVTLDAFLEDRGNPKIDLIKVDVEGAEVKTIRGMAKTLRRLPEVRLIVEFSPPNLEGAGFKAQDLYEELLSHGLKLGAIKVDGTVLPLDSFAELEKIEKPDGYVNLLCCKR